MKPKILILDSAEQGKRVNETIKIIRNTISKSEIDIHFSTSNRSRSGEYFPVNDYLVLFIHTGDNLKMNGEQIFDAEAENLKIPLFIFSGGYVSYFKRSDYVYEISYQLLKKTINGIINCLLECVFDFEKLWNLLNEYASQKDLNDFLEKFHSFKHDFLNRMGRILPEINQIITNERNIDKKYVINFDTTVLNNYLTRITDELDSVFVEFSGILPETRMKECKSIVSKITELKINIDDISKPVSSRKKFILKSTILTSKVEEIKNLFEITIKRAENE